MKQFVLDDEGISQLCITAYKHGFAAGMYQEPAVTQEGLENQIMMIGWDFRLASILADEEPQVFPDRIKSKAIEDDWIMKNHYPKSPLRAFLWYVAGCFSVAVVGLIFG